jgi:hypothetical protein
MLVVDVGSMAVEVEPSCEHFVSFVAMWQIAAEEQSSKMVSDMEVGKTQRFVIEFLHVERLAPIDIHRRLMNIYGDTTVGVNTLRRWVVRFIGSNTVMRDRLHSLQLCQILSSQNEEHVN